MINTSSPTYSMCYGRFQRSKYVKKYSQTTKAFTLPKNTTTFTKKPEFTECSTDDFDYSLTMNEENERLPNTYLRRGSSIDSEDDDYIVDLDDSPIQIGNIFSGVKPSLKFKKPSNKVIRISSSNSKAEYETQCDSLDNCSDVDCVESYEMQSLMSEDDYMELTERIFFLVKETKQAKSRGLISPIVLRNKLYDLLDTKKTPVNPELLFEECNFTNSTQIRSYPDKMIRQKGMLSDSMKRRRTSVRSVNDSPLSSLMSFLTQTNC